jgi:protein gp37
MSFPNVWLGVTCEDQRTADERIPVLLQTPAAVHFISAEPLLEPITLDKYKWLPYDYYQNSSFVERTQGAVFNSVFPSRIDWLIAGCESGRHRHHLHPDAFRNLRNQCRATNVPYFLKQMEIDGKVIKMPTLDGELWDQIPDSIHKE